MCQPLIIPSADPGIQEKPGQPTMDDRCPPGPWKAGREPSNALLGFRQNTSRKIPPRRVYSGHAINVFGVAGKAPV